jgi:serine/threonine-protein kinase
MVADTSTLTRYRELSTLGTGGMARVTLAEDTLLGRRVALKRLPSGADPQGVSRLRREALVGASISHPNVVSIYDVVADEDGQVVVVMEYVAGETLRQRLDRRGQLPPEEALPILEGVAAGLDAVHARGVVHRDVKPGNVLLGSDGSVKLADLGIASAPDRTRITTAGSVLGSIGYMAPEQLEGGPATPALDIYALAAVAFEVLSGRRAYPQTNPVAAAQAIAADPPPDLREAWSAAPPAAASVLARGMARDPHARPRSATALTTELRRALEAGPMPAAAAPVSEATTVRAPRRPPPAQRRLSSVAPLLAPLALAAVLLTVVLALLGSPASHPHLHRATVHTPTRSAPPATRPAAASAVSSQAPPPPAPPGHRKHHHGKHDHNGESGD